MDTTYQDYIDIINEVEKIEEVVIKDNKIKKCCNLTLEVIKVIFQYLQNVKNNIHGKKEKEKD